MQTTGRRVGGLSGWLLVPLLLLPAVAVADPPADPAPPPPPTIRLEPVTVTSRRIEEDADKVPAAVTAVERDDIRQGRPQVARQVGLP